jgi:hypothetical protein
MLLRSFYEFVRLDRKNPRSSPVKIFASVVPTGLRQHNHFAIMPSTQIEDSKSAFVCYPFSPETGPFAMRTAVPLKGGPPVPRTAIL